MIRFLDISNHALFWYYLASNFAYLMMLMIALKTSAAHQRSLESHRLTWINDSPLAPPIAIIAPAHNEEGSIRVAVRNLLELDYPELELIVVNDGSDDGTLEEMREEFRLRLVRAVYIPQAKSALVRGLYRSDVDARLLVIDKEPGGSKADAVNAGLNAANSPYVCVVDADSVLERDALLRIMVPILEDPKRVVAVGGIIRVLNGSEIQGGTLRRVRLPRKSIEVIQVIEYLRAFLIGREAWAQGNMLTIISLGVLSREFFLQFLIFGYAFATVISIGSVLQEEITYKRYNNWQDVVRLVSYCFFEHFPYRQMHMVWRLQGLWQYFRGDFAWICPHVGREILVGVTDPGINHGHQDISGGILKIPAIAGVNICAGFAAFLAPIIQIPLGSE